MRALKTAVEIQTEVQRQVREIPDVKEGKVKIYVPLPLDTDPVDGCNWTMPISSNAMGPHMEEVTAIINNVMDRWNLQV